MLRKPWQSVGLQLHLERRDGHQRLQGNGEPVSAHDRGMQAAGHVAQLVQRLGDLAAGAFQSGLGSGVAVRLLGKHAEFEGEGYQALLGTVVQVAFQAATLVLLGFDNPGTGAVQFLQPSPELCFEPAIFQGDGGGCADRLDQLRLLAQRGVVHQCRNLLAVLFDEGDPASAVRLGKRRRIAVLIGPAAVLGQPVDQGQGRVAQRLGQ